MNRQDGVWYITSHDFQASCMPWIDQAPLVGRRSLLGAILLGPARNDFRSYQVIPETLDDQTLRGRLLRESVFEQDKHHTEKTVTYQARSIHLSYNT